MPFGETNRNSMQIYGYGRRGVFARALTYYDQFTSTIIVFEGKNITSFGVVSPKLIFNIDEQSDSGQYILRAYSVVGKILENYRKILITNIALRLFST